jgi:4-hydroxy-tetrahydrodipicolinate synthase
MTASEAAASGPTDGRGRGRRWTWDGALSGVVPPAITPLDEARELNEPVVGALVEHVLAAGCSGLFVLGGCGEGAWLPTRQRGAAVRAFVRAAAGRAPVLVGVMLPATERAVEAARQAAGEGADAVVVGSPYYFPVDGAAQRRHIETVIEAASRPALLYNIPQCTHQVLAPATVEALARDSRVLGIKDSAGDFVAFEAFLAAKAGRADFRVLQGHEHVAAASLRLGADGLVPGLANVVPGLMVELRAAASRGDGADCARIQAVVRDLCGIYEVGHWLPALKAASAVIGIAGGPPALPLVTSTEAERRAIAAILGRHGLGPAPAGRPPPRASVPEGAVRPVNGTGMAACPQDA